jgi:hypothetical protein
MELMSDIFEDYLDEGELNLKRMELMSDIFEDYLDEGDALSQVNTGTGSQLSDLVRKLRNIESQMEDAEQHLKALKADKHKLSTENIPALMDEMGVERLDVDGVTVSRKMIVHASIPADRKEEAFTWLRDNNLDDIIKNDVTLASCKSVALIQRPRPMSTHLHSRPLLRSE